MNQIFDNLISNPEISFDDAYELAFILMDIKIRNPRMRKKLFPVAKDLNTKELNSKKLEKEIREMGRIFGENQLYEGIEKELLRQLKDENYAIDLCNRLLLYKSKLHTEYAKYLASLPFYLYKAPESKFFITNDNPGFSQLPGGKIEDTHFNDFLAFRFPLNPNWLLHICNSSHIKSENRHTKKIIFDELKSEFVDYVNLKCLENCNEYILSNNKKTLCEIKNIDTKSYDKFNATKPSK